MITMEIGESGRKNGTMPRAGEHVIVHCTGFSCLGYLDQDGTWKSIIADETLPDVIDFSPIN